MSCATLQWKIALVSKMPLSKMPLTCVWELLESGTLSTREFLKLPEREREITGIEVSINIIWM
jgi:hypothetical protein